MITASRVSRISLLALVVWSAAPDAFAQSWTGGYIAGHVGFGRIPEGADNAVVFDRDLDGDFDDTITTARRCQRVLARILCRRGERVAACGRLRWTTLMDADRFTVRAQGPVPATNPFILGNASGC